MKVLPEAFCAMVRALPIPSAERLLNVLSSTSPEVSVRRNPSAKGDVVSGGRYGAEDVVAWSEGRGIYLPERPDFTHDPLLHGGAYYVQDASSMALNYVVSRIAGSDPVAYADVCAAPGGKTTCALSSLPSGSLVVANEYVPKRASILRENLVKWGDERVVVSVGDTAAFRRLDGVFDIVACDVPCSGEGMMRKDDEAVAQWSPSLVRQCASRQREIIANVWGSLKPGGYLIYSTCTFNTTENDDVVRWMMEEYSAEPVAMEWPAEWGIVESHVGSRFMPHLLRGEGLFVSVLRKPTDGGGEKIAGAGSRCNERRSKRDGKEEKEALRNQRWVQATVMSWVDRDMAPELTLIEHGDTLRLFPSRWTGMLRTLEKSLKIVYAGVEVARIKGRDIIPAHGLAMWRGMRGDAFPTVDLELEEALEYLSGDAPRLPEGLPKGYVAVRYEGVALGWMKNIGNRANNLYPKEWRIRVSL